MWRIGATSRVQGKVNLITGRQLRDPPGYRLGIQVGSHSSGILDPDNHLGDVMSLVLRRKVRIAKNRKGKNMEAARKDASSFFKDLTSLSAGDLGPPGDAAYDSGRQPWTRLRATAPDVLEGDVMSVERPFTDEKWAEFGTWPISRNCLAGRIYQIWRTCLTSESCSIWRSRVCVRLKFLSATYRRTEGPTLSKTR